jgi:hypothetical protein
MMEPYGTAEKVRENRLRRQAKRLGLRIQKSRARHLHFDDHGEYQLIEERTNTVVVGEKYDLSLDDVEEWLNDIEAQVRAEREGS